jgi:hypothetical protein
MGDEKSAEPNRLTAVAQNLNRIAATRYPDLATKNLPPHLTEQLAPKDPNKP